MNPLAFIGPVVSIISSVVTGGGFMGSVKDIIKAVADGKISVEEAHAEADKAWSAAQAQIVQALSESASKTFAEAQETIRASFQSEDWMVRRTWAFVVWSQTTVLLWYQIGIPIYVKIFGGSFPTTGDQLLQWSYALVGGALGLGGLGALGNGLKGVFKR